MVLRPLLAFLSFAIASFIYGSSTWHAWNYERFVNKSGQRFLGIGQGSMGHPFYVIVGLCGQVQAFLHLGLVLLFGKPATVLLRDTGEQNLWWAPMSVFFTTFICTVDCLETIGHGVSAFLQRGWLLAGPLLAVSAHQLAIKGLKQLSNPLLHLSSEDSGLFKHSNEDDVCKVQHAKATGCGTASKAAYIAYTSKGTLGVRLLKLLLCCLLTLAGALWYCMAIWLVWRSHSSATLDESRRHGDPFTRFSLSVAGSALMSMGISLNDINQGRDFFDRSSSWALRISALPIFWSLLRRLWHKT